MRRTQLAVALLLGATPAAADDIGSRLSSYEQEVSGFGADAIAPVNRPSAQSANRLAEAQVAFSLGDYDRAALMLFDLADKSSSSGASPEARETATYYLGEALFQKGDIGAAHQYFADLAATSSSKYYEKALVRLVEIAVVQRDASGGAEALGKLESAPGRSAAVPYVKGKFAFSQGRTDDALSAFAEVPKGSQWELQALYFAGASHVAKKDLAKATDVFTDLITRKPRTIADRRVLELGALALGRVYYEREQPIKSVDAYLLTDRHSDLFSDAVYEVAWVYVKGKQYDKALQALQLLNQSDAASSKTSTTRILEGNLRIRKAQSIRVAQINGQPLPAGSSDPATEYEKAAQAFQETHNVYLPSYQALSALASGNLDAAAFVEQIAGRSPHVFAATAPIPDAAAQALREQPDVQQVVSIETDLRAVKSDISEAEDVVARLEGVLASGDRTTVYPQLAARRHRIAAISDDVIAIRSQLADRALRNVDSNGSVAQLTAARKQLELRHAGVRNAEKSYADRISAAHGEYNRIDAETTEISTAIDSAQAIAVALRKYAASPDARPPLADTMKAQIESSLLAAAKDAASIEDELAAIRREIVLGKDLAGVADQGIAEARELRKQLKAAQDAEHRALAAMVGTSRNRTESASLAGLGDRAARLAENLAGSDLAIDQAVAKGLDQVKAQLAQERQNLITYRRELSDYEAEGRTVAAAALAGSVNDVRVKYYDVLVRADVGQVDVAWSQKQDTDDDLKRLNLARNRELRQLQDEFKGVLSEKPKKPSPAKPADSAPVESPSRLTSPDKASGASADERIRPVEAQKPDAPSDEKPAVKPGGSSASKTGGKK